MKGRRSEWRKSQKGKNLRRNVFSAVCDPPPTAGPNWTGPGCKRNQREREREGREAGREGDETERERVEEEAKGREGRMRERVEKSREKKG